MLHPLDREKESDPTERQGTGNERKGISTFTALTAKTPGAPAVRAFWKQQLETKFHGRKKMKRLTAAMAIAALAVALWPVDTLAGPTLDAIKKRGKVICGVNGNRAGFSALDSKGQWKGMDVDTCKAVAAAILGDKDKV
jgi:ABC-type amino acid transport substrate-binding protein